ncbi:MAG: polysaccharide deacetylase family protein [Novosphingobium sp.]
MLRISDLPAQPEFVRFKAGFGQRFMLTVDTEEEFDWDEPLNREVHTVHSVVRLAKFQEFCEGLGVIPVYLVDYPIVSSPSAIAILKDAVASRKAEVGVQLHPWVNPPHDEEVNQFNSFAGNLPPALERAKFQALRDKIEETIGVAPLIYRAGRYGVGPNTTEILTDCGMAIDTSVRSRFDYSAGGGPNFRDFPLRPYWLNKARGLMELPLTSVFWGPLRQLGPWLYPQMWRVPRLRGLLSKIGLLERIPLTPEGVTITEALRGIDIALDDGLPVLVFSFHSPSLAPGFTPYVRNEDDLDALYDWWRQAFGYLAQRGVRPICVGELIASVELA